VNLYFVRIELILWVAWVISWFAAALVWKGKSSSRLERRQFRPHFLVIVIGFYLMVLPIPFLGPLWSVGPPLGWTMVALVAAGILLAWWARIEMGKLWSGGVERMEDHRVIQTGPFAIVRHPIYTGLAMTAIGVGLTSALPTALLGAALFTGGFAFKAKVEERFLEQELGGYAEYRKRVPMLVPGLQPRFFSRRS